MSAVTDPSRPDPVADLLARVIQEHRIRPSAGLCSCSWQPTREASADPLYLQYLLHAADQQAKALRSAGLVLEGAPS